MLIQSILQLTNSTFRKKPITFSHFLFPYFLVLLCCRFLICENSTDAIWCLNKSLAYISGSDNHEISWEKAIEIATKITENIENALEWWSDIRIVGDSEHNMVILLLLAAKKINLNDSKSIDERINQARADGYFIPESI